MDNLRNLIIVTCCNIFTAQISLLCSVKLSSALKVEVPAMHLHKPIFKLIVSGVADTR